jgi:hypothetical protein
MKNTKDFKFIMISAMYENGGNTLHRLLDGHPQIYTYPFESQPGTKLVQDYFTSTFPVKYRWPVFDLAATPQQSFMSIIDEEARVRSRTPHVSKFRHIQFEFSDQERGAIYADELAKYSEKSRAANVASFFTATFKAWKDYRASGRETHYLGYSPIIGVDADKILQDFPQGHVIHVVRNPWSAYADTKKRPVPLSLPHYMNAWMICQTHALKFKAAYPDRMHIVRFEDYIADRAGVLGTLLTSMGLEKSDTVTTPTWNGEPLKEVYPWGTIRIPTEEVNLQTARELSAAEIAEVRGWTQPLLSAFKYDQFKL